MKVETWEREEPKGYAKIADMAPFGGEGYEGTAFVDSALYVADGGVYLGLLGPRRIDRSGGKSRGFMNPVFWRRLIGQGGPPDLYDMGGHEYESFSEFVADMEA